LDFSQIQQVQLDRILKDLSKTVLDFKIRLMQLVTAKKLKNLLQRHLRCLRHFGFFSITAKYISAVLA
jgi:hypothetical protein